MGKINSREKGARFERELARTFRDYGYTGSRRTAQYCGNTGDASDVVGCQASMSRQSIRKRCVCMTG